MEDKNFDPVQVVTKSIPALRKTAAKSFLPIYKYLNALGIHSKSDYERNQLGVNMPLHSLKDFQTYNFSTTEKNLSLHSAIKKHENSVWKTVALIPYLDIKNEELSVVRDFIRTNFNDFLVKKNNYSTYMRKLICYYDWRVFGWDDKI